ncbi:MAG: hypothetical protein ACP5U2_00845 [Bryobacteraceae bacterium]
MWLVAVSELAVRIEAAREQAERAQQAQGRKHAADRQLSLFD